jgi:squalene-hopene/tetraprenyl-beta-curcumene cyclase
MIIRSRGAGLNSSWLPPSPLFSWPIDTNLATWVTTLSINALGDDVPLDARPGLRAWLLRQQYRVVHPYTNAAPGGWAWTDLPGGVPDADDTPGAMLALCNLGMWGFGGSQRAICASAQWLVGLQNRDRGWPTFCRGWGTLPFDRSSPDITGHVIRALIRPIDFPPGNLFGGAVILSPIDDPFDDPATGMSCYEVVRAVERSMHFLKRTQRPDGSWLPLWFGNQHAPNDENPTYGTAKVLAAFQALGRMSDESAVRGVRWLVENQNPDGGWGAGLGTPSSVEETALALETLLGCPELRVQSPERSKQSNDHGSQPSTLNPQLSSGLSWLIARVEDGRFREPSPIGFYFAKLWYFEALYPLIFTVAALRKAVEVIRRES